jgi:AraC-like DNA-binding protein
MLRYEKIKSVSANSITYPPESTFGPRIQTVVQMFFLHKGVTTVQIDGESVSLKAGEAILLLPDHVEYFVFSTNCETVHSWFHIDCVNLDVLSTVPPRDRVITINQTLHDIIQIALREDIIDNSDNPFHISFLAAALTLALELMEKKDRANFDNVLVSEVKKIIYEKYQTQLTLEEISKSLSYSQEHIIRTFKANTNTTPIKFLWDYRKKAAIYLLENSGLPLTNIAKHCGFCSYYHFCRQIKQETGLTPTQLRKDTLIPKDKNSKNN